jgi:hypothetical protein
MSVELNLVIEQGANFTNTITIAEDDGSPKDLTDFTFDGAIRRSYSSLTAIELTVEAADPTTGVVTLSMEADATAELKPKRYVYDVYMVAPGATTGATGVRTRVVEGIVSVTPSVSRPVVGP